MLFIIIHTLEAGCHEQFLNLELQELWILELIHGFEYAVEIMDGFILVDGIDWVCGSSSAQKSRK